MSRTWKNRFGLCFFRSDQLTCNRSVYVNVWKFNRAKKGFEIAKVNSSCFCWFPAAMLVPLRRGTNMASHTKLCNFPWYIFSNNLIMRYRKGLWLSHVVYVSLFYNISISWLYWMVEDFVFYLRDDVWGENHQLIRISMVMVYDCAILATST